MSGLYHQVSDQLILRQHPGQLAAWDSGKRIIAVLAGTQGGKTSWLPWWLWREIQRTADPAGGGNDYLAVTASYDLFKLKFLPALREVFEHVFRIGRYWAADRVIELRDPATGLFWGKRADDRMWGRIILRSAESGGGLESATARGAIGDEAGQDSFTIETWWALRRRIALHQARICIGTTLYNLGWLKSELYDPWEKAKRQHAEIDVIQFDSVDNPAFPADEYERARLLLPRWKFDMQYRGRYSRPAGLIYDSFNETLCKVPRFAIPDSWQRYLGLDFGGVNTAGVFFAEEPTTKRLFAYREYKAGGRSAKEHAEALINGEPMIPFCVGGSKSEGQWRTEFRRGGLPVGEPDVSEVEIGINRVYAQHAKNAIVVFDDLAGYLDEKGRYSRKVDAAGEPTEEIEDKNTFHHMDAERYIIGRIRREG